jgi:thiamine-monophosphate kinase
MDDNKSLAADEPTISAYGEKRLIAEFIRPLFNQSNKVGGVGDDCAMLDLGNGQILLISTDRVPADLTAFRLGILDYNGLGRYLASLNLSDIAACGGKPEALLLNLGLPSTLTYAHFTTMCQGFGDVAAKFGCEVLGGDITQSAELSISATCIGRVTRDRVLTRRGATPGDAIFVSRPLGLTPASFAFHLQASTSGLEISESELTNLRRQFTLLPMMELATWLSSTQRCSSCMDNTDGIGQSLLELSTESKVAFVLDGDSLIIPPIVQKIADGLGAESIHLAFSAGADFSLVGTTGDRRLFEGTGPLSDGQDLQVIGWIEAGSGVWIQQDGDRKPLAFSGWNYFSSPQLGVSHGPVGEGNPLELENRRDKKVPALQLRRVA